MKLLFAAALIQALLDGRVAHHPGAGIVAAVIDHGVVTRYQSGVSGNARPLDSRTLFEIGSVTKTFTATVLEEMVEQKKVHLNDPVAKYLPSTVTVPAKDGKQITLLNLATQHSGLPKMPTNFDGGADPTNPYAQYTVANLYDFLNGYQLTRDPGAAYEYSNLGEGLLGLALSRVARIGYEAMVRERVWRPLGMADTTITLNAEQRARLAVGHNADDDVTSPWDWTDALAGAGAIRSDLDDMIRYAQASLQPGPLHATFVAEQQPRMTTARPNNDIGLVWMTDSAYHVIWHDGSTYGYNAVIMLSSDRTRAVVVMSNGVGVDDIAGHILSPSYALTPQRHSVTLPSAILDSYVGTYKNPDLGITYEITRAAGGLHALFVGQPVATIHASRKDHFYYATVPATIEFVHGSDGNVVGLVLRQNGRDMSIPRLDASGKPLVASVAPAVPASYALDPQKALAYIGTYHNNGNTYVITSANGHVYALLDRQPVADLLATGPDTFEYRTLDAVVDFQRDASGKIVSLTLHQAGLDTVFTLK